MKTRRGNANAPKIDEEKAKKIKYFNENKPLKVSNEMYAVEKIRCKLSVHGNRLLFALAQSLDYNQTELFPEVGFSIDAVFKYLGIENSKNRHEELHDALNNIGENPLKIKETTKRGGIRWSGHAWITDWELATDSPTLYIRTNDRVKKYLVNLKRYALIRPKDYLNLNTEYQNWFYPYFKNVEKAGIWAVSIEDLKFALFLEKTPSYNPKKNINANTNFFKKVLGIEKPNGTYQEGKAWEYTKDRKGELSGTLAMISERTDINVSAWGKKTAGKYTHVIFNISSKRPNQAIKKALKIGEEPQPKTSYTRKTSRKPKNMKDLFSGQYEFKELAGATEKEDIPNVKIIRYDKEQVREMAKGFSALSFAQFIEKMNLKQDNDGNFYKEN